MTGQEVCDFPVEKMVYVMTDFTENNFKFWAEHPVSDPGCHTQSVRCLKRQRLQLVV